MAFRAGQCAFCVNGMVRGAPGRLEGRIAAGNRAVPSTDGIRNFLSGASEESDHNYLCRRGAPMGRGPRRLPGGGA